jgi:hypothetical protein
MALWQADHRSPKFPSDDSAPSHGLSQVVLEGSLVNLDVTSPAATLALTLMFLKTNDRSVADMLVLPDTTFNLDFIRPSCILLRVVARSLIMWDSIEPSQAWVMRQMPDVISMQWPNALKEIKAAVAEGREFDHEAVLLAHIHAVAGACLALGLRYAGVVLHASTANLSCALYVLHSYKGLEPLEWLERVGSFFSSMFAVSSGMGILSLGIKNVDVIAILIAGFASMPHVLSLCRDCSGGSTSHTPSDVALHPAVPQDPCRDQDGSSWLLH